MSVISQKIPAVVTMRYVIMSVLNRLSDYSMKSYLRYMQMGIEFYSESLSMFHIKNGLEVVYLHMSTGKTVELPADFVDFVKIGYPVSGKLRVITNSENILLPRTYYGSMVGGVLVPDSGEVVGNADAPEGGLSNGVYFSSHWRGGAFVGGLFGLTGGIADAYYRIDRENRQIVFFGSTPRSEIVLEYISSSLKSDGSSLIPREAVASLRTYVLWQSIENDHRVANNEKERRKRLHEEEIEALRSFSNSFTASEYLSMVRSTYHQSIKR